MFARHIAVVGTGYVGLTTGACLASLGHRVVCADLDAKKIEKLRAGEIGIQETGLAELVAEGLAAGRLSFVVGAGAALAELAGEDRAVQVVFMCVPTPMGVGGVADLSAVEAVVEEVRSMLPAGAVLVNKSTVPVGTADRTVELLDRPDIAVVSNPEFLREGSAVRDFLNPDRIVVGSSQPDAAERVAALYARLGAPTVLTDPASAEMIKYAANCFLAMKLSYVNALAELCERLGADIKDVTEGIGYDRRVGQAFLSPGPGWGGSCLPKDTHALLQVADAADFEFRLLRATIDTAGVRRPAQDRLQGHRPHLGEDRHEPLPDDLQQQEPESLVPRPRARCRHRGGDQPRPRDARPRRAERVLPEPDLQAARGIGAGAEGVPRRRRDRRAVRLLAVP